MSSTARRDGIPEKKTRQAAADVYVSKARPARRQHVDPDRAGTQPTGEGVRLQKVLAQAGVASRRMAERLIDEGRVEVDGKVVTRQGVRVDPNVAVIRVDGSRIVVNEDMQYFVLNKPRGVQCTMSDDQGRPCVGDIIGEKVSAGQRLFHVGRLDAATEGLLILTNDGELANRLMHPSYNVTKTYMATVIGEVDNKVIRTLTDGIELDDGPAKADFAQIIDVWQGGRSSASLQGRSTSCRMLRNSTTPWSAWCAPRSTPSSSATDPERARSAPSSPRCTRRWDCSDRRN